MTKMPDNNQNSIPPEQKFAQPGAVDHDKLKSWWTAHHVLAYIVLGLLVLAIASVVLYLQVNKSVPEYQAPEHHTNTNSSVPADWKTYSNTQYGFEFKSPDQLNPLSVNGSVNVKGKGYTTLQVVNGLNPSITIVKNWMDQNSDPYTLKVSSSEESIGGITWDFFYDPAGGKPGCDMTVAQTKISTGILRVEIFDETHCPGDPKQQPSANLLKQILSTFKFTKTEAILNSQYGWTVESPSSDLTALQVAYKTQGNSETELTFTGKWYKSTQKININDLESILKNDGFNITGQAITLNNYEIQPVAADGPDSHIYGYIKFDNNQLYDVVISISSSKVDLFVSDPLALPSAASATNPAVGKSCIQVITTAKDPVSGIIKDFPTPCDVPAGWTIVAPNSTNQ